MGHPAEKNLDASELSDGDIVRGVIEGNQALYQVLVQRYQGRIFSLAFGVLHNREDAREVAQEAFIKAYRNLPGFRQDSSFYTWLYRITRNLAIDSRRRAYRNRETVELDETRLTPDEAYHTGPRPAGLPSQHLERKRLRGLIAEAIEQLPEDQRSVILLREVEGLSYKEIAATLGCAEGTVMSRLFYARKRLQDLLGEHRRDGQESKGGEK